MNYNFNSQYPYAPWSSGNPYMPNGFTASNNAAIQIPAMLPALPSGPGTFRPAIIPGVRFNGGMFGPYGMNGSFQSGNFPSNWTFSYNHDVSQFNQVPSTVPQTQGQSGLQVQPVTPNPSVPNSIDNDIGQTRNGQSDITSKKSEAAKPAEVYLGEISDAIAAKVTTLLTNPNILKNALSTLKNKQPVSLLTAGPRTESEYKTLVK